MKNRKGWKQVSVTYVSESPIQGHGVFGSTDLAAKQFVPYLPCVVVQENTQKDIDWQSWVLGIPNRPGNVAIPVFDNVNQVLQEKGSSTFRGIPYIGWWVNHHPSPRCVNAQIYLLDLPGVEPGSHIDECRTRGYSLVWDLAEETSM